MRIGVAAGSATRPWTPLVLTLCLHLLLVLAWRWQVQTAPVAAPSERLIELVRVRPPPSAATTPPRPLPPPRKTIAPPPPVAAPPPLPVEAPPTDEAAAAQAPPAPAEPGNEAPVTLAGEELLSAARRSAAVFDRDQRKGKSGVPLEADTPWSRFRAGLAAAHVDRSLSMRMEKYESPDGVVIYRTTQAGKQSCHMTGAAVFGPGRAGGGSAAGSVACPTGVRWERM